MRRFLIVLVLLSLAAAPAFANHAWGTYHWSTTSYPMPIKVGDNVTSTWDPYLTEAINDWNKSTKLALVKVAGQSNKRCGATAGRIEVCNSTYGQNGWLGIAQIWLSGGHISQAVAKMNDTYFNTATYNKPEWRDLVMCQEVGHDFGLGHQDENFSNGNLGTCMDYTNCPSCNPSNLAPNSHDYQQLDSIYNHTHGSNSYFGESFDVLSQSIGGTRFEGLPTVDDSALEPWEFGTPVKWDNEGRPIRFVRTNHDGDPHSLIDVFWAPIAVDFHQGDVDVDANKAEN